uniref:Uncharacterized protein n=1 Tax=Romanomermis culicivorax TaxID=13658 RepID=A0A915J775_ROMCU
MNDVSNTCASCRPNSCVFVKKVTIGFQNVQNVICGQVQSKSYITDHQIWYTVVVNRLSDPDVQYAGVVAEFGFLQDDVTRICKTFHQVTFDRINISLKDMIFRQRSRQISMKVSQ